MAKILDTNVELSRLGLLTCSQLDHQAAIEDAAEPLRLPQRALHTSDLGLHHTEILVALLRKRPRPLVVEVGTFQGQAAVHLLKALPTAEASK